MEFFVRPSSRQFIRVHILIIWNKIEKQYFFISTNVLFRRMRMVDRKRQNKRKARQKKMRESKSRKRAFIRTHTEASDFFFFLFGWWWCRMLGTRKKKNEKKILFIMREPVLFLYSIHIGKLVEYELRRTHTLNWHTKKHKNENEEKIDNFAFFKQNKRKIKCRSEWIIFHIKTKSDAINFNFLISQLSLK